MAEDLVNVLPSFICEADHIPKGLSCRERGCKVECYFCVLIDRTAFG